MKLGKKACEKINEVQIKALREKYGKWKHTYIL
jgi:hypothetical protein